MVRQPVQTVAVTGAAGIVGIRVVQQFLKAGYTVHALVHTRPPAGHPLFREHVTVTVMDLATTPEQDVVRWFAAVRPSALIHCAAWVDVAGCESQPSQAYLMNTQVTGILAKACSLTSTHFILLSTEYVFDGTLPATQLYHEYEQVNPLNHYGKSKVQAEIVTQETCAGNTVWTVCRTAVLYGSTRWNRPDFLQWLRTKLSKHEMVWIARDLISSPTCASDLAGMLVALVEQRLEGVYHTTGRTALDRYHFAVEIARCYNLDESLISPIQATELGVTRPLNVGLCVEKIRQDTGIRPFSVQEGLAYCRDMEQIEQMEQIQCQ